MVQKSYGDISIQCKKDEAYSGTKTYPSEHEGAVWGNLLFGGLIGYAVDAGSGAGFAYPPQMNVDMIKAEDSKEIPLANADSAKNGVK
jgi:hypothetical protein